MKRIRNVKPLASSLLAVSLLLSPLAATPTFAQVPPAEAPSGMRADDLGNAGLWGLLGLFGLAGLLRRRSEQSTTYAAREQQPGMPRR